MDFPVVMEEDDEWKELELGLDFPRKIGRIGAAAFVLLSGEKLVIEPLPGVRRMLPFLPRLLKKLPDLLEGMPDRSLPKKEEEDEGVISSCEDEELVV
jgi:hypothetical protein